MAELNKTTREPRWYRLGKLVSWGPRRVTKDRKQKLGIGDERSVGSNLHII